MVDAAKMESIAERQENELEVLKAIYMDDVKDLREKDAWNVRRPPEIQISLGPQASFSSKEVHVCVVFVVKCPAKYPDVIPHIRIENPKGLSQQQVDSLLQELRQMCQTLIGEVMILDLCQHIQKFLHAHNKPPSLSFYDEMITTKRVQEEKTAREQVKQNELLEQKQAQSIDREIKKRQEALKEDARKRREQGKATSESRNSGSDSNNILKDNFPVTPIPKDQEQRQRSGTSPEHYKATVSHGDHKPERLRRTSTPLCGDKEQDLEEALPKSGTKLLVFNTKRERKILLGGCVGQSCRGSAVYVGLDSLSGDVVVVSEWVLKWRHTSRKLNLSERQQDERESTKYIKQVFSIEKELLSLLRLSHKHLVHYHGFRYVQDNGRITMHLLLDHVGGGSLAMYVRRKVPLDMSLLRNYGGQTLEALAYLHERGVVHKDLRASSMMLDQDGSLRLSDISLTKRLVELVKEVNASNSQVHFEDDFCPVIGGRSAKKADIFRLGCVLLCLAQGEKPTNTLPEIPTSLPAELQDFLGKCLTTSELQRWSASQLLEHSFVKSPLYKQPLEQIAGSAEQKKVTHQESEESGDEQAVIPFIPASDSGSRLQNEFEILKGLGKGGFGDVIKVKNKLDGRYYAIKRIPLNPSKKAFTRKITREVQLLSMLNHENVVRYYNSWIETSSEPAEDDSSSSDMLSFTPSKTPTSENVHKKRLDKTPKTKGDTGAKRPCATGLTPHVPGGMADWEHTAPPAMDASIEWSVSVDFAADLHQDDSSEDEDFVFGASILPQSDSEDDGIVFEHSSNYVCDAESESPKDSNRGSEENSIEVTQTVHRLQFLYIQMEFCEKSTLRTCIDMGLYEDVSRVWRLFREIVEGLTHIHKQGMIHRDLKPVNIFLDCNDHVKIGDFGLATTEILTSSLLDRTTPSAARDTSITSHSESAEDAAEMTGKVGTALYVAPEMSASCKRTRYSQKVDIYSLGVIFFEMCYRPLPTGMERVKILSNLRDAAIQFPDDIGEVTLANQVSLLRLLLTHDPSQRPTASEILQSDFLPPPQMEEAELNEVLRSTIANPDSKLYKHMMDSLFSQPITPAMDFVYDNEVYKTTSAYNPSQAVVTMGVTQVIHRLFKGHCAVNLSMPLLMPKCDLYDSCESYVCVMDHIGGLVALPYDLKTPFARFVARYGISDLKRYTIDVVYRESRVYGLHPKELLACSYDIVTPTMANLVPDAEVISVIFELIQEFPELQNRNYYLRINHKCLLKGILLYCGVREELHHDVYTVLGEFKTEHRKAQLQTRLYNLSLTEHTVETIFHFVETEGQYKQIASMLRKITKTKGLASTLVSKGLKEVEAIISHVENFGVKTQIVLTLSLISNISHFSGVVFQVVRNVRRKSKQTLEVLAAGGRYDNLVAKFRKPGSSPLFQCVVGISVSVDRIVAAVMEEKHAGLSGICDVLVCSLGSQSHTKEKLSLLKDLWAVGIRSNLVHDSSLSLEEIQDHCRKSGISHIVVIKDAELRLRSIDKDKVQERRCSASELLTYLQKVLAEQETAEHTSGTTSKSSLISSQVSSDSTGTKESRETSTRHHFNISHYPDLSSKNTAGKNTRRIMESQIYGNITSCLSSISTKCHIEIVAVDLTVQVLKTVTAFLELNSEEKAFNESIGPIMERHPRHRKYLTEVFDEIYELKFEKHVPVIILYGLKDDSYKVLL